MKGKISLKDFILEIKNELEEIQTKDIEKAFFELKEVLIEVSFALDASAEGSGKFVVVDLKGTTKSTQTHRVSIKLDPIKRTLENSKNDFNDQSKCPKGMVKKTQNVGHAGLTFQGEEESEGSKIGPLIQNDDPHEGLV